LKSIDPFRAGDLHQCVIEYDCCGKALIPHSAFHIPHFGAAHAPDPQLSRSRASEHSAGQRRRPRRRVHRPRHHRQGDGGRAGAPADEADAPRPELLPYNDPNWQAEFFIRQRLAAARIPARFAGKTLENYSAKDKIRKMLVHSAQAYISGFTFKADYPKGLLMSGGVGCGKSHLAVAILKGVIAKGYSGLYYNSPDLMRDIRATFDKDSEVKEDDLLEEVTTTDLLVFDDVGAENVTGFVLDRFYLIINERYEGCKPVIITTNLDEPTLENRLGKRIVSRLSEMCETFGPFPDEDWRRKLMH
jgi:DNA replication protein DnaC